MKSLISRAIRRSSESERGFTLIEMLIVVGIIVALAAAIVPQVVQFGGKGESAQKESEVSTIQAAMDSMVVDKGISSVTADATPRNDWQTCPVGTGTTPLFTGGYVRVTSTLWGYTWDSNGKVTQTADKLGTDAGC